MDRKRRNTIFLLFFWFFAITWTLLLIIEETRPFALIYFGSILSIGGLIGLYLRIDFDLSIKEHIIGELVFLEHVVDSDGSSYRPHYKYVYNNEEKNYRSNNSTIFKRSKSIGEKEELLILVKNPNRIRVNKVKYTILEYFATSLTILMGLGVIFYHQYLLF